MSYPATNIRLLITHREADESTIVLAEGLAALPDFKVYMTREGIASAVVERGVTYLPSPRYRQGEPIGVSSLAPIYAPVPLHAHLFSR